jgi:hypothetical protein
MPGGTVTTETPDPNPEPFQEPSDPHMAPLEDDEDARYLDPVDPRRIEVERRRGRPFLDDDEGD